VSRSLAERTGRFLRDRTGRRSFLQRTALGAAAVTVAPRRYLLEPVSAYAALCSCSGSTCDCGASCCDGYTEFCCSLSGHRQNFCPAGTELGGWWKADGSGLCGGAPRYYMDCNVVPPANPCSCGCANGNCGLRKACCTRFRYGQCHQEIATMGAIMCRVVTCTAPWEFDPTCTRTVLTDNNTRFHDAPCLHAPVATTAWCLLRDTNTQGPPDHTIPFGMTDYVHVAGDWTGKGYDSIGAWDPDTGTFYLRNSNTEGPPDIVVQFGARGYTPLVGDWNGDGTDTIGVWDPATATFHLRNSNTPGPPDISVRYGASNWTPLVGDWDGNGTDTIGVWDPATATFHLRNANTPGSPSVSIQYGSRGYTPVVGDWTGSGADGVGAFVDGVWSLRNHNGSTAVVRFGGPGTKPLVGDWDGGGADSLGVVAPNGVRPRATPTTWALRNENSAGAPSTTFTFGMSDYDVIVGDWNGDGAEGIGVRDPLTRAIHLRQTASAGGAEITITNDIPGTPVAGRWLGPGAASVGWYADGTWRLRRTLAAGSPIDTIRYGAPGWIPLVGDWNGDGTDTIGVWDPATATFHLRNSNSAGNPHISVRYGAPGWIPLVGDWNGDGVDTIGVWDPATATFHLRNSNTAGNPDLSIHYGAAGYRPVVGDWDGSGTDTIGVLF
jgi:hypothetical protein